MRSANCFWSAISLPWACRIKGCSKRWVTDGRFSKSLIRHLQNTIISNQVTYTWRATVCRYSSVKDNSCYHIWFGGSAMLGKATAWIRGYILSMLHTEINVVKMLVHLNGSKNWSVTIYNLKKTGQQNIQFKRILVVVSGALMLSITAPGTSDHPSYSQEVKSKNILASKLSTTPTYPKVNFPCSSIDTSLGTTCFKKLTFSCSGTLH